MMTARTIRECRELTVHGSPWRDVLAYREADLKALLADVPGERLLNVHRNSDPADSLNVLVGPERHTLWLGDVLLARKERP